MKYLYTIVMAMLVLASCSENERMVYTDTPGIYFLIQHLPQLIPQPLPEQLLLLHPDLLR